MQSSRIKESELQQQVGDDNFSLLEQFDSLLATEAIIAFARQRVEFAEYSGAADYEPALVASYLTVMRQDTQQRA